jgi:hypothetical protein
LQIVFLASLFSVKRETNKYFVRIYDRDRASFWSLIMKQVRARPAPASWLLALRYRSRVGVCSLHAQLLAPDRS